jgi:hypothetical protein
VPQWFYLNTAGCRLVLKYPRVKTLQNEPGKSPARNLTQWFERKLTSTKLINDEIYAQNEPTIKAVETL